MHKMTEYENKNQKNMESGQHIAGGSGGSFGDCSGRGEINWVSALHGSFGQYGTDLSCGSADLCKTGGL